MNLQEALAKLPESNGAIVILSGGMDSTIAMRLAVEKYGAKNVKALSFNYNQIQIGELSFASTSSKLLEVQHRVLDLKILGKFSQGFSANIDKTIQMPTIKDVLGVPRPPSYVPNRNMILMSLAASFAEVEKIKTIIMGLQTHDEYSYHDCTQDFIDKVNECLDRNRIIKIKIIAPFIDISKTDEIKILQELDGNVNLLQHTLTCYNPKMFAFYNDETMSWGDGEYMACGKCPSCSERLKAFQNVGIKDPIRYM